MPGLFIDVALEPSAAADAALGKKLQDACPVDIFQATDSGVRVVEANLDECTLCDLCLEAAPQGAVRVIKLYEK